MTTNEETRVLQWLRKRASVAPERAESLSARIRIAMWIALVVFFVFLFGFASSGGTTITIVGFIAFAVGTISGFLLAYASALKQWNVIIPHVNQECIERRLNDLKPNKSLERTREG